MKHLEGCPNASPERNALERQANIPSKPTHFPCGGPWLAHAFVSRGTSSVRRPGFFHVERTNACIPLAAKLHLKRRGENPISRLVWFALNGLRLREASGTTVGIMKYQAVVDMHLPGGFTKLRVLMGGGVYFDVSTDAIPSHLRRIGSSVVLCLDNTIRPGSIEEARSLQNQAVRVEDPSRPNK